MSHYSTATKTGDGVGLPLTRDNESGDGRGLPCFTRSGTPRSERGAAAGATRGSKHVRHPACPAGGRTSRGSRREDRLGGLMRAQQARASRTPEDQENPYDCKEDAEPNPGAGRDCEERDGEYDQQDPKCDSLPSCHDVLLPPASTNRRPVIPCNRGKTEASSGGPDPSRNRGRP